MKSIDSLLKLKKEDEIPRRWNLILMFIQSQNMLYTEYWNVLEILIYNHYIEITCQTLYRESSSYMEYWNVFSKS